MARRAFIVGLEGPTLLENERVFLRDSQPWGVILFARNIVDPDQARALTEGVREVMSDDTFPVLVDQEGGRVQRLRPPHCRAYPSGAVYGQIFRRDSELGVEAAHLSGQLIGNDLSAIGINVDCLPVLDLPVDGSDQVIGNRALSPDPQTTSLLGSAQAAGLRAAGVEPVMKHLPGHGRATADTHKSIARISEPIEQLETTDFIPFRALANEVDLAMTAHVVISAVDSERPATQSKKIIASVIRDRIGFNGVLMTDDISMQALDGPIGLRSERALEAGCDLVLHCNGVVSEMEEVAAVAPELSGQSLVRCERVSLSSAQRSAFDRKALDDRFDQILDQAGA